MSYNLIQLAKDAVTNNLLYVDDSVKKARLELCKSCNNLKPPVVFSNTTGTCSICSCFMDEKTKYAKSTCPINKW